MTPEQADAMQSIAIFGELQTALERCEKLQEVVAAVERERDEIIAMAERRESALQARLAEAESERERLQGACDLYRQNQIADLARLAEVHQTLAPLVDDDNRPVEALARHAVARLAEAEALLRAAQHTALSDRIDAFLAPKEKERE